MDPATEIALDAIRAVEQRDPDRLFALFHEHVEFYDPESLPYGGVGKGRDALRHQLETAPEETWLGTWGPLQPTETERAMEPEVVSSDGSQVVIRYTQRALSPSGERFEAPVLGVYEVREGKLARAQMFHYDTAAITAFLQRAHQTT